MKDKNTDSDSSNTFSNSYKDTATNTNKKSAIKAEIDSDVRLKSDFEGKFKSDIKNHNFFEERKGNKWETKYPNGESYSDLFERLSNSGLNSIYQKTKKMKTALLTIGHESINRVIPQILTPERESNEQASKNRQKNNEIIVIKGNLKKKVEIAI